MSVPDLLLKIDRIKHIIDERRPLQEAEVRELDSYFKIGLTYSSNALEGNSLTLDETKVLLEDGITAGGKPLRDCYEAAGHADAYEFMLTLARAENFEISEESILKLHRLFYTRVDAENAGRYRAHQVIITGTEYLPPAPGDVPRLMAEFVADMKTKVDALHPVLLAAFAHRRLVDIHPFADGNGRTARLLMNLILVNKGYCIVSIPPVLRREYIAALKAAQREKNPSNIAFDTLIADCEIEAQKDYCRMFRIPYRDLMENER